MRIHRPLSSPSSRVFVLMALLMGCQERSKDDGDTGEQAPPADDTAPPGTEDTSSPAESPDGEVTCPDSSVDADCDGLLDRSEDWLGTDKLVRDTDGDGLTDGEELMSLHTHPLCIDTDQVPNADGLFVSDGGDILPSGTAPCTIATTSPLYDLWTDVEPDGILSADELLCGANPLVDDADGDGLSDAMECDLTFGPCDPEDADTDDDGLTDREEIDEGTQCARADTDGDGVSDYDELNATEHRTDPTNPDTDGDQLTDGDELLVYFCDPNQPDTDTDGLRDDAEMVGEYAVADWADGTTWDHAPPCQVRDWDGDGAIDGAEVAFSDETTVYDPRDAASTLKVLEVGQWGACEDVVDTADVYNFDSNAFYASTLEVRGSNAYGVECECRFNMYSPTEQLISGVSIFADQSIHQGTEWWDMGPGGLPRLPMPAGVVLSSSWLPANPSSSSYADLATIALSQYSSHGIAAAVDRSDSTAGTAVWQAFSDAPDGDGVNVDVPSTYREEVSIRVSFANPYKYNIGTDCSVLNGNHLGRGLNVRIDAPVPVALPFSPGSSAWLPPSDTHACHSGVPSKTRFGLIQTTSRQGRPVFLSGDRQYAGGALQSVTVADWHGAERLVLQHNDGRRVTLRPDAPSTVLDVGWTLAETEFTSHRSTDGTFRDPELIIESACPQPIQPDVSNAPPPGFRLGWSQVLSVAKAAGASEALLELWPSLSTEDTDSLRLRLVLPTTWQYGPSSATLRLDAAGAQTLATVRAFPVVEESTDPAPAPDQVTHWAFSTTLGGVVMGGQLILHAEAATLELAPKGTTGNESPWAAPAISIRLPKE